MTESQPVATAHARGARSRAPHDSAPASPAPRRLGVRGLLVALVCAVVAPFVLGTVLRIRERADVVRVDAGRRALDAARLVANRLDDRARNVQTLLAAVAHQVRSDRAGTAVNDSLLLAVQRDLPAAYVTSL